MRLINFKAYLLEIATISLSSLAYCVSTSCLMCVHDLPSVAEVLIR